MASVLWLILIIFHRIISEKFKRSLSFLASYTFGERNIFYCGCAVYVGGLEFVFGFWLLVFLAVFDAAFLSTYWQDSKDDAAWELWFFDRAVMDLAGKILFAGILRFAASRNRMSFLLIQRLNVARLKADVQMNPFSVDNLKNWLRPKPLDAKACKGALSTRGAVRAAETCGQNRVGKLWPDFQGPVCGVGDRAETDF